MPRKGPVRKRPLVNDPVHGSPVVTQVINRVLRDGKKSTAERIVYGALAGVEEKTGQEALTVLKRALDNIRPSLEVRSRRVGGATYQVPTEVKPNRANALAIRWLVDFARERRENTMLERLQNEVMDASNGLGAAVRRREDVTVWPRRTAPSLTIVGKFGALAVQLRMRPSPAWTRKLSSGTRTTKGSTQGPQHWNYGAH